MNCEDDAQEEMLKIINKIMNKIQLEKQQEIDKNDKLTEQNKRLLEKLHSKESELNLYIENYKKLEKELKLKDSRIAAYERSETAKSKKSLSLEPLNTYSPPTICPPEAPKIPHPEQNIFDFPEVVAAAIPNIVAPIVASNVATSSVPDNYTLLMLDDKEYYLDTEENDLYDVNVTNNKKVPGDQLGKLKNLKTKSNGKEYIYNTHTNRVYNTDDEGTILDWCGNIVNGKLKLI
jgi:hypothetical protein